MLTTQLYGRLRLPTPANADRVAAIFDADGAVEELMPYAHHDADFAYDRHGYETVTLRGAAQTVVAFTATRVGRYRICAYRGAELLAETPVDAAPANNPGFVEVSKIDPRYFAYSDGAAYAPIGLNLIGCDYERLPEGVAHFVASQKSATTGMLQWRRWFGEMKKVGVNYARIWLSHRYTEARTEIMGVHDPLALARFDALSELARASGVRLKLCLEHWRTFSDANNFAYRRYLDPDTGKQLTDEETWFNDEKWNRRWLADIAPYLARCRNDPLVFAWEVWNEIDCGVASFPPVADFTARMLREIKKISPRNLATNSLGSFDSEERQARQDYFRDLPEMDFQQVHRYLDQGAPFEICRTDPLEFSLDAVRRSRRADKPIILTETGAVNDCHVGPFRFYPADHDGLIFHDVTYPAFFAGAAGSGHIWHWNQYVEPKNLWRHFRPLTAAIDGIQLDAENFVASVIPSDRAWILALTGKNHSLIYVRNKADRWDYVLRDGQTPAPVTGLTLPSGAAAAVQTFWLMDETPAPARIENGAIVLPPFVHGCVLRTTR
jgi:hypothetical protein